MTWTPLISGIIITLLSVCVTLLLALVRKVDILYFQMGSESLPKSILGRMFLYENEFRELREWALSKGFNRRHEE